MQLLVKLQLSFPWGSKRPIVVDADMYLRIYIYMYNTYIYMF